MLKNWCFQTMVLERTLVSPLDSEEIKPVNLKGEQPQIFIGRIDAELKLQHYGHLRWRANSMEKTLMLWKFEGRRRGWDGCMVSLMHWTWTWASYGRWWGTGKPGVLQSMGSQSVGHDLATEQQRYILFILTIIELMAEFSTKIWKPKRPEKFRRTFFEYQDCTVGVIKWLNAQNLK